MMCIFNQFVDSIAVLIYLFIVIQHCVDYNTVVSKNQHRIYVLTGGWKMLLFGFLLQSL